MFKFSFKGDNEEKNEEDKLENLENDSKNSEECECQKLKISEEHLKEAKNIEQKHICTLKLCETEELRYVSSKFVIKNSKKLAVGVVEAESLSSDLIPGKYEGGLKIWECTYDLLTYLVEKEQQILFKDKRVLDLGCGAGLLGLLALKRGAKVVFQDYNTDVLEFITIPNTILNMEDQSLEALETAKFYSGDWNQFLITLQSGIQSGDQNEVKRRKPNSEILKLDIILSSETIYNPKNYKKIYEILTNCLEQNGVAFIAAKTYYFGVGGDLRDFEEYLMKDKTFRSEVCFKIDEGVKREILKVTRTDDC